MARKVKVIAHRGAHEDAPPNSLDAFEAAIRLGCDYIEIDLRTTAAGQLVIKHDALQHDDVLPSFDDVLALAKGRIRIYLDVKQAMPAAIVAAVERHRMRDAILTYGSFQLHRDLVQLRPGWPCMPEAVDAATLRQNLSLLKPPAVAFSDWDFKPELVRVALDAGCEVFLDCLGKSDTPTRWQAALEAGATGIQTDRPAALIEWRSGG
ncbi:MAG TPA: glycerophosphodiester phosphodiesterase family protein [Bryobacteraceae bacterium]|nr:glycerophosphodiester phosphodiesterase family protein [Bryobacteraceae bacterium]